LPVKPEISSGCKFLPVPALIYKTIGLTLRRFVKNWAKLVNSTLYLLLMYQITPRLLVYTGLQREKCMVLFQS
jgi:hypothetical protein